jgi:hypothetical protein
LHFSKLINQQGSPGLLYERAFFLYQTGNRGLKHPFQPEFIPEISKNKIGIKAKPVGIKQPETPSLRG